MGKKVRILAMVLCGMIQAVVLIMYSFTESKISAYPSILVWTVCACVIREIAGRMQHSFRWRKRNLILLFGLVVF